MKIFLKIFFAFIIFLTIANTSYANENSTTIYLFYSKGCPHCAIEKEFLQKLEKQDSSVNVKKYEISQNQDYLQLFIKVGKRLSADTSGVPFTVIGDEYIIGFFDEETTGNQIKQLIEKEKQSDCPIVVKEIINKEKQNNEEQKKKECEADEKKAQNIIPKEIKIPLIGGIQTKNLSLTTLTIIIAALDGFNPCAMWVLIFLISMLLGMKDRKRMWILGTAFIITSAFVYFLIMAAWLNLFLFLGFLIWIRIIVGLFATGVGIYNIREFFINKNAECKVTGNEKRRKTLEKIKGITQRKELLIALFGIILLAFAVNLIEAICSAGLPAIYTQILSLSNLPLWQYYLYILLYLFIFMIDDLIVFFIAMTTLHSVGLNSKYVRYSHIIGGIVMIIIGILMLFRPELLMFG